MNLEEKAKDKMKEFEEAASQLPILSKNFTVVNIAQELFAQEEYEAVIDLCDAMLKQNAETPRGASAGDSLPALMRRANGRR